MEGQARRRAVVGERGACRSHAAEEGEGGCGVLAVSQWWWPAEGGRVVDGGAVDGCRRWWWRKDTIVARYSRAQAGEQQQLATARRRLRPSGCWSCVRACVSVPGWFSSSAAVQQPAAAQRAGGREGQGRHSHTHRTVRASLSWSRFWACNFSHAGQERWHHGSIGCFICGARR